MSTDLLTRMRTARETWVDAGKFRFRLRRPTTLQLAQWRERPLGEMTFDVIVDWQGVTEQDLVPGGAADPAPFSPELCAEFLGETPDVMKVLMDAVIEMVRKHREKQGLAEKN